MSQDKLNKLNQLNELEVYESSADAGELEYVYVENTPYNRNKLLELGATEDDLENMECDNGEVLDVSVFAFEQLNANWFEPGKGFR